MIDNVAVNNANQVASTGEVKASPPPSSPEVIKGSETAQEAAKLDLSSRVAEDSNKRSERVSEQKSDESLEKELKETIEALNDKLNRLDREVQFKLDKKIDRTYISVIDKGSKEVIREFPPKDIRTFIARFDEFNTKLDTSKDVDSMIINLEV